MSRLLFIGYLIGLVAGAGTAMAQAPQAPAAAAVHARPTPPTRDPITPGYVTARELPDGTNAPANVDGNFIIGARLALLAFRNSRAAPKLHPHPSADVDTQDRGSASRG